LKSLFYREERRGKKKKGEGGLYSLAGEKERRRPVSITPKKKRKKKEGALREKSVELQSKTWEERGGVSRTSRRELTSG